MESLPEHELIRARALAAVDEAGVTPLEGVEMLVEIAMGLQSKPQSVAQLRDAVALYDEALARCPRPEELLAARVRARKATALAAIPDGSAHLEKARVELETALPMLGALGSAEEAAEAEMNLGLVIQSLAGARRPGVKIGDAIACYQRALRVFDRQSHPTEFAILHNNLATAYLSIPLVDERAKMREALAVQSFTEALKVITLIDNPFEYAMLQNNLGNALQYAASGHPVENNLRALEAYDEALKVRNPRDTPGEYANTVANRANCLRNLPDDPENPGGGNQGRLRESRRLYREANQIFRRVGELEKVAAVAEALGDVERELGLGGDGAPGEPDFGEARIS